MARRRRRTHLLRDHRDRGDRATRTWRCGIIERFAGAGREVSIDDYGTGLSSLAYLKQIRADELKIDKAFVLDHRRASQRDALLVRSTVDLAHSLGLKVTAEGVETPTPWPCSPAWAATSPRAT